jgi:PAS domain S-box-containing protein
MVVEHVRDITDRHRAEQALKDSEGRFRTLIEDIPESLFLTDVQGTILTASRVAAQRLGKSADELTGANTFDLFPPEVAARRQAFFVQAVATGRPVRLEDARGERYFDTSINPILDADGKVSRLAILALDITDRKKAEQALKESEATLRTLIEANPESLFLLDTRGVILAASHVAAQRLGKSLQEIIGADLHGMLPSEVSKERFEIMQGVMATGQPARFEDVRGDIFFDSSITPIFDQDRVVQLAVLGVDITERKKAEQALKDSEARLRAIFATAQDTVFIKDRSFRYTQVNPAMERLYGRPAAELIGKTDLDLVEAAEAERIWKQDRRVLNGEVVKGAHTVSVQGVPITFHYIKAPLLDEAGEIVGICGIARDITDLRQAEDALEESEERFRMLFDHVPDAYILADMQGEIIDCNQAAEDLAGYGREELVGNNFACLPWLDFRQQVRLADLLAQAARGEVMGPVDFTLTRKDGGEVIAEGMNLPLYIQGQNLVLTIVRDVTARKRAEAALRESEELYRSLFENMLNGFSYCKMLFDRDQPHDFIYLDVNSSFEALTGLKDVVGKKVSEVIPGLRESDPELLEIYGRVALTGKPERFETYVEALQMWFSIAVYSPAREYFVAVFDVITARKEAEAALRESEARFRHISSTISDISYSCTVRPDGSYALDWLAGAAEHITGYSVEEIKAQRCWRFMVIEADQPLFEKHITGLDPGSSAACELRLRHKNGGIIWVESFAKIVSDPEQPERLAIYGGLVDISARKQAEEALRESERQKSILNEILQIFLTVSDEDMYGEVLQVVLKTMKSQFGVFAYQDEHGALVAPSMTRDIWEQCNIPDKTIRFPSETWGETIWARAIHQKQSLWKNEPGLVPEGHLTIENVMVVPLFYLDKVFAHFEVANKEGGYSEADKEWLESIAQFIAPVLHARLERDRKEAERHEAEAALAAHLEFLRLLLDTIPNPIFFKDAQGAYLGCNKAFEDFIGVTRQEIVGKSVYDLSPMELADEYHRMDLAVFEATGTQVYESRVQAADGTRRHVVFHKATFPDPSGGVGGLVGMITDITGLKQTEAELRESESRFRLMAETIQDVFWIASRHIGKTVYVSPGFEYIWGRTREALYRHPKLFLETVHPEDRDRVKTEIIAAREGSISWDHEYRIIRPDGTVRWIHNRGFPVRDDQGRVTLFTGVATDVTEHKVLEGQLLQAQKMEAVGRLAGGVAHDFNNLLMAITGYGELMRAKVLKDDPLYGHLENILKAGERAAALTRQLLTFSRQQIVHPEVIDLNRVVLDLEPMLRRLIGEDLHLEVVTDRKPAAVKADPGQMGQIIMNLVVNARDAMPQGGRLTLKTAAVEFKESRNTRFGLAPPGAYMMLAAQDTGVGMDEATQAHIFEPFFTTKEPGKGTGLGLSTVYGIVKQSGGYLDLVSEPGAGSTFTIFLPRLEASVAPPRAKPPITANFQGEETVLLVEDEDMLRGLLAKFLRLYGYTVLEARHGGEALLTCERHPGPIHLMVTDVVMPQMSGRELADRLTPLRPEMKILYMSGYTEDTLVQHGVADLSVTFLQKPFRPIELARRVHAVLHPPVSR